MQPSCTFEDEHVNILQASLFQPRIYFYFFLKLWKNKLRTGLEKFVSFKTDSIELKVILFYKNITSMCLHTHRSIFLVLKIDPLPTDNIKYNILRESWNINVRDSTIFSTNGCRNEINEALSYFVRYFNIQNKFAAAHFYSWLKKHYLVDKSIMCIPNDMKNPHTHCYFLPLGNSSGQLRT